MKPQGALIGGCYTDKGGFRAVNQDAAGVFLHSDRAAALGVVCDGIGGLEKSEEASQLVLGSAATWFNRLCTWLDPRTTEAETVFLHFLDAAEDWNARLYEHLHEKALHSGTTFSGVLIFGSSLCIISVGDSRIYKYSPEGSLSQLTVDDTRVELYDGRIRSYLTDHFGKREELGRAVVRGELAEGEMLIICSDGYYHGFTAADAQRLYSGITEGEPIEQLCRASVLEMIARGETDNISLGIIFRQRPKKSLLSLLQRDR